MDRSLRSDRDQERDYASHAALLSPQRPAANFYRGVPHHARSDADRKPCDPAGRRAEHRRPLPDVRTQFLLQWRIERRQRLVRFLALGHRLPLRLPPGRTVGVNFHGGGDGPGYTPIADNDGSVVGARPEFYGILLFTLAGQGTLYTTQISAGSLNVTAYAVSASSGGLKLIVVNKDQTQNLQLAAQLPQSASSATLIAMTQLTSGATAPDLSAT